MEATIDGLVLHCQGGRFTGVLRMRAKEGIGELWFLSGITDEVHFGTSEGDEAMERMRKATDATYELVARLPHPGGGFKKKFPIKGSVATATPVTLMRYCERYALTCTLAVESKDLLVEAMYEMGDLVSVETTADDDGVTSMLEATEGSYEFKLPRVELPAGTPVLPPAPASIMESIPPPEAIGVRALLEIKPAAGKPTSDEAEVKRKTVEMARQKKAMPARAVPRPTSPKPPEAKPVEPKIVEAKIVEAKVVEAKPVVEEKLVVEEKPIVEEKAIEEKPVVEEKAAPAPKEEAPAAIEREPAQRSLGWLVVPLMFAAAVIYLLWTNRM